MFGPIFDGIVAAVLAVIAVILLLGKGEVILRAINGSRKVANKKRTEAEKKQYSRVMGVFTGVLALSELLVALYPDNQLVIMGSLAIVIMDLVAVGFYSKKYT